MGEATREWAEAVLMIRPHFLLHVRHGEADGVERRGQVERDDQVPFVDREFLDRRDMTGCRHC